VSFSLKFYFGKDSVGTVFVTGMTYIMTEKLERKLEDFRSRKFQKFNSKGKGK